MLQESSWKGPLPPPQDLAGYEETLSGSAERILRMAEKDLDAQIEGDRRRLQMEETVTNAILDRDKTGQAIAFLLAVVCFSASIVFFAIHNYPAGGALLAPPVLLLIRAFLDSGGLVTPWRRDHDTDDDPPTDDGSGAP